MSNTQTIPLHSPHLLFQHSEIWKIACLDGTVEVKRWKRKEIPGVTPIWEGLYMWNVYAYVNKSHPLFEKIKAGHPYLHCVADFPMHKGANYLEPLYSPTAATELVGYKVGCDYNYVEDEWLTHISTPQAAESVFRDALRLRDWMDEKAK